MPGLGSAPPGPPAAAPSAEPARPAAAAPPAPRAEPPSQGAGPLGMLRVFDAVKEACRFVATLAQQVAGMRDKK